MKMTFTAVKCLVMDAGREWSDDKASRLGAALAYYTVFSIAPLLLITIAIVGFVFGDQAAHGNISGQISSVVGAKGAEAIQTMLANANEKKGTGIFATIISTVLLLFGASGVFVQLKDALNTVWDVPEKKSNGIMGFIKSRFLSFGLVLGVGFILLASLALSTVLSVLGKYIGGYVSIAPLLELLNFVVSFGVITALFAMIFKFLPDIKLPWRDVWLGAAMTALLFTIGKFGLGLYLGKSSVSSAYGAAGSFVVLLVWIYYSAQILFFGAELTQVYSHQHGSNQGRKKKTVREKETGVATIHHNSGDGQSDGDIREKPVNTDPTITEPAVTQPVVALDPESDSDDTAKPNPVGKAVGTIIGAGVAVQAVVDALRHKK